MTDDLVDKIRKENYLLEIFDQTKSSDYVSIAKNIVAFIKDIYRHIEPSHFDGQIIVLYDFSKSIDFKPKGKTELYDKGILNNAYSNIIIQIRNDDELPFFWCNVDVKDINGLLEHSDNLIAYVFQNKKEYFVVNKNKIDIPNQYSCPSIFALQYHYLNEALVDYKNERVKNVSCEHLKKCWDDNMWIYLINKPEKCMQISLSEFLKSRIRGVNVNREFNLGASKPVDVRVYWREANRAALIELKWLGQSLKEDGTIGTSYSNNRANEGMEQIKEYIDLNNGDNPTTITKGYLVVIDARRRNITSSKVSSISREDGFHYASKNLNINADKQYWSTYPNIEYPIRMFVEPICEM